MGKWRYGIVIDAGSSGSRLHVYKWLDSAKAREKASAKDLIELPELITHKKWVKKVHPGMCISTFGEIPNRVGPDHLQGLFEHAFKHIPEKSVPETPIFLLATAGMRLLEDVARRELLHQICSYTRANTAFQLPDCSLHIQVIPGDSEGLYGWIAANYLLGGFNNPSEHEHGKGHHTYGFLDMGGASAQIAFAPNATEAERHSNDLKLLRMRTLDGQAAEYRVFVTTWLGFGVNEARKRYVKQLVEGSGTEDTKLLPDPCLPIGLTVTKSGDIVVSEKHDVERHEPHFVGTGRFDECLRSTYPLLDKDAPCEDEPCLLHGVHVPAIDFDVNHFVGVSEYWHTTHEFFEMAHKDKTYDLGTYQAKVKEFCSQDWKTISTGVDSQTWGRKVSQKSALEVCFKAAWVINVLHKGIGIPSKRIEAPKASAHNTTKELDSKVKATNFLDPFQAVDKIKETEVSWTLGKMVLYAASQVPPVDNQSLPVGFGSNAPGIPKDFQQAGSDLFAFPTADDDFADEVAEEVGEWQESLFDSDSSSSVPGTFLVVIAIFLILFLLLGRDRRARLYRRTLSFMGGRHGSKRRRLFGGKLFGSSPVYERILEDGEASNEFELGEADSENDASDSSDGTTRIGRASGWATPSLKVGFENSSGSYFDNIVSQGAGLGLAPPNAMDRSGLVVRTESRERLAPGPTSSGKRSRAGSPSRMKSPLIPPKESPYD
ncbi:MAG: Golgi apyrase [Vezdaea aestivalis]|nr:MAG: Golgi apyrase [Vezdaea aestivalis]